MSRFPPLQGVPLGRNPLSQGFTCSAPPPKVTDFSRACSKPVTLSLAELSVHSQQPERQKSKGPGNGHHGMAGASKKVTKREDKQRRRSCLRQMNTLALLWLFSPVTTPHAFSRLQQLPTEFSVQFHRAGAPTRQSRRPKQRAGS